jgi:hypothetical protein
MFADLTELESSFTAFIDIEGSLGADIQNLLELTGIQPDLPDRSAECSPAEPIRPIGRTGIMPGL